VEVVSNAGGEMVSTVGCSCCLATVVEVDSEDDSEASWESVLKERELFSGLDPDVGREISHVSASISSTPGEQVDLEVSGTSVPGDSAQGMDVDVPAVSSLVPISLSPGTHAACTSFPGDKPSSLRTWTPASSPPPRPRADMRRISAATNGAPRTSVIARSICCRTLGSQCRVQGSEFGVQGSEFGVQGSEFGVQGSEFEVQGSEFGVQGSEFEVQILRSERKV
jgi:hypothetical protein